MRARRSRALPIGLAVVVAGAVGVATAGADDAYRAEAALPLDAVVDTNSLTETLRLAPGTRRPRYTEEAPQQPGGHDALDAAVAATLRAEPALDDDGLRDSIRFIDSTVSFLERRRQALLVRVEQPDAARAELAARAFAAAYAEERRRWLRRELGAVERRLASAPGARSPRGAELSDGVELTRVLVERAVGPVQPRVSVTRLASDPVRDVVVAALVGLLLGLAIVRLRGRPCVSSS